MVQRRRDDGDSTAMAYEEAAPVAVATDVPAHTDDAMYGSQDGGVASEDMSGDGNSARSGLPAVARVSRRSTRISDVPSHIPQRRVLEILLPEGHQLCTSFDAPTECAQPADPGRTLP